VIELAVRSLSNLHEALHHSHYAYLPVSADAFLPLKIALPLLLGLPLASLALRAMAHAKAAAAAPAPAALITTFTAAAATPAATEHRLTPHTLNTVLTLLVTHAAGAVLLLLPAFAWPQPAPPPSPGVALLPVLVAVQLFWYHVAKRLGGYTRGGKVHSLNMTLPHITLDSTGALPFPQRSLEPGGARADMASSPPSFNLDRTDPDGSGERRRASKQRNDMGSQILLGGSGASDDMNSSHLLAAFACAAAALSCAVTAAGNAPLAMHGAAALALMAAVTLPAPSGRPCAPTRPSPGAWLLHSATYREQIEASPPDIPWEAPAPYISFEASPPGFPWEMALLDVLALALCSPAGALLALSCAWDVPPLLSMGMAGEAFAAGTGAWSCP
jgi:hypothetical protein